MTPPQGPVDKQHLRWFHRSFFEDFEADGKDGTGGRSRFDVLLRRLPESFVRYDGAPTTIDACASYY